MIRLYEGHAPGSELLDIKEENFEELDKNGNIKQIVQHVTVPGMYEYLPEMPIGTSVIIIPGGAFKRQVMNQEGEAIAKWFNTLGIAAYVLKTRLPIDEHANRYDVILMDVQRAVRLVRARSKELGRAMEKVGVMGFSAGGYSAALGAVGYNIELPKKQDKVCVTDEVDKLLARPDFCVLGYPAISLEVQTKAFLKKAGLSLDTNVEQILNNQAAGAYVPKHEYEQLNKYNPAKMVTVDTPPAFIFETDDDNTTPCENSIEYYMALRKCNVPAELHIFTKGSHGFGLGEGMSAGQWRTLLVSWLREHDYL